MNTKTWTPARSAGITEADAEALGNLIADFAAAGLERFGGAEAFMAAMKAATK